MSVAKILQKCDSCKIIMLPLYIQNFAFMPLVNIIHSRDIKDLHKALATYPAVFVVADRKLRRFITEPLVESCAENGVAIRAVLHIRTSERRKNLRTMQKIQQWLIRCSAERNALVLAVGGGITTDLAGYAACTYKRGVKYANVPTTLLAQVDAAIGGKTGCNIGGYKNMTGVIRQPEFTYINTDYLKSLSWDLLSAGYAELVKTFIIGDAQAYRQAIDSEDFESLGELVQKAAAIKASVVEADQFESGQRRVLNLGHTFAHAIEYRSAHSLLHRGISHGHAVAMGMVMAARLSERLGEAKPGLADMLEDDFRKAGLPVDCPWTEEQLQEIILTDKKAEGGKVNYVLIRDIGDVIVKKL